MKYNYGGFISMIIPMFSPQLYPTLANQHTVAPKMVELSGCQ